MKTYAECRYNSTHSLTSALDVCEWSASRPERFIPSERTPGGPQSRSGRGGKEKISEPLPRIEPPIIQPEGQRCITEVFRHLCERWVLHWKPQNIHKHMRAQNENTVTGFYEK
jgi:hypothetical protein